MITLSGKRDIKVLIVDDSAVVRKILARELETKPGITVVGTAPDPYIAREKIVQLNPDVLSLDIEMPRMDGITFLRKLMAARPMPVIVLSSLGEAGGPVALDALEAGAMEVVCKPGASYTVKETCNQMAELIFSVAKGQGTGMRTPQPRKVPAGIRPRTSTAMVRTTQKILAIGASTGGVQSLTKVFSTMPATSPGIVVVQHMPPRFTSMFAERLNQAVPMRVKEAAHGDRVVDGQILIAPGGKHMTLNRSGAVYNVNLNEGPPVCLQRPSVDVLFQSVAKYAGSNAIGALLTGMGADGAQGLREMRDVGCKTIAQDEASCIVFGMPKEAIKLDAAEFIMPLDQIAGKLLNLASTLR